MKVFDQIEQDRKELQKNLQALLDAFVEKVGNCKIEMTIETQTWGTERDGKIVPETENKIAELKITNV